MRTCVLLLLVAIGCGSPQSNGEPSEPMLLAPVNEPAAPSEPSEPAEPTEPSEPSEPTGGTVEPDDSSGPVIAYSIDGNAVDEATFNALFERLDVDEAAYQGESVVRPDGSYGGAGQSFHARDGDVSYRYEFHTHPREDGRAGQSRMLTRE